MSSMSIGSIWATECLDFAVIVDLSTSLFLSRPLMDGKECIGQRVAIFWPNEDDWFEGTIAAFDSERGYRVEYDDGDEEYIRSLDSSHVRRVGGNAATLPRELAATPDETQDWGDEGHAGEDMLEGSEAGLGLSTDNFSPLPMPRVDNLHRIVEQRVNERSSTIFEEDGDDRSQPLDTQDDYARLELLDLGTDVLMGHGGHHRVEEEESDEEPLAGEDLAGEEVAILDGEVLGASDLPCSSRCVARVLYAESSGANVLFACKTTVHQTEPSSSADAANPEWAQGGFRFELLAPIPGDPITGELIFAVLEAAEGGGTRFLGQTVINLASAAKGQGGGEGRIDGTFPLRDRKGDLLSSGSIRLRLHVVLPLPRGPNQLAKRPSARPHASSSTAQGMGNKRPGKASTLPAKGGVKKAVGPSATTPGPPTKPPNVARKWHHATTREKEQERIAKENRLQRERMARYKHTAGRGSRPSIAAGGAGAGGTGLTIEIPGEAAAARGHKKEAVQDKYSAEALSSLQQEVSGLRDRLKLLTAKQARLEAISKRSVQAKASRGTDKGASLDNSGEQGTTGASEGSDPLLSLGVGSFSDDALVVLEGRNAELVGLYRDLLARRATWQSKVETYRGEWSRSNEGVVKVGQRLEEAERARKCSTSEVMGQGRGDSQTDAAKVVALQARAADLRVEIEALRTAKELKLSNGDLVHEVRVLQCGIDQSEEMAAEKRQRLQAVVFDRDAFRAKHDAVVNGQLHERLTESVSALQLALLVLSKERQWNILVEDGVKLQVDAGERKLAARAERELAEAKANIGQLERGRKEEARKESKGE